MKRNITHPISDNGRDVHGNESDNDYNYHENGNWNKSAGMGMNFHCIFST